MMADFLRFAVIMAVVMLGFAVSFFALVRDDSTWLKVFNAMLGDTAFFEDFEEHEYEAAGTILLMGYLLVITILLLNLLIAVLSTSHANVQGNAAQEFKVSKARFVQHYRFVVDEELLPPPFNLLQVPVRFFKSISGNRPGSNTGRCVGLVVFYVVLAPFAVVAGSILWMVSAPFSAFWAGQDPVVDRVYTGLIAQVCAFIVKLVRVVCALVGCMLGAPFLLVVMWGLTPLAGLWGGVKVRAFRWVRGRHCVESSSSALDMPPVSPRPHYRVDVNKMLKEAPGGLVARELSRFIEDPMSDPKVREDEKTKPTRVEHIKLLRNRLEEKSREQFVSLRQEGVSIEQRLGTVEKTLGQILEVVRAGAGGEGGLA